MFYLPLGWLDYISCFISRLVFLIGNSLVDDNCTDNKGDREKALPCEAWWKRHAICLYKNVKEVNTIWSVLVATALMGIVFLGQRWHKEKWQVNSRWRFYINNEVCESFCSYFIAFARHISNILHKFKTLLSTIFSLPHGHIWKKDKLGVRGLSYTMCEVVITSSPNYPLSKQDP
jgi:hypothetical protein